MALKLGTLPVKPAAFHALAPWLLLGLLIWLCWSAASLFWQLVAPAKAAVVTINTNVQAPTATTNLANIGLFSENNAPLSTVPETASNIKLEGVFESASGSSAALINVNGQSKEYKVGATLDGTQTQLASVAWNYVVLRTASGAMSQLKFGQTGAEAMSAQPKIANGSGVGAVPAMPAAQRVTGGMVNSTANVDRMLDEASSRLRINPAAYLAEMGLKQTGKGYEITAGAPQTMAAQIGLKPGDVVTSVNGVAVGQVQKDAALIEQLKMQRSAQITVQRGQQTVTVQQNF